MNFSATLMAVALTIGVMITTPSRTIAQERTAVASQLGVFVYPKNNQDQGQQASVTARPNNSRASTRQRL